MTAHNIKVLTEINSTPTFVKDDEYSNIPLCLDDLMNICKEYNKLGWQIQNQVENIVEMGIEEAIKSNIVKQEALPYIKDFLISIRNNPYFGEAGSQADDCIKLIQQFQEKLGSKSIVLN